MLLWLASSSPRRKRLLSSLGLAVRVVPSGVDESSVTARDPQNYVARVAAAKADAVAALAGDDAVVIGCDTEVVHDGVVLGKPRTRAEAATTLARLAGGRIPILSGLRLRRGSRVLDDVVTSTCELAVFDPAAHEEYLATGVWRDKAAGLAVQHDEPSLIDRVGGCFANAVGLPSCVLVERLHQLGVRDVRVPVCHADRSDRCREGRG